VSPRADLRAYSAKRDFAKTPEPPPRIERRPGSELLFVVHKHAARRLHYDLRLELDGTLKSWAVAKGPSLVPGEKRLAIHVEDHPLDYADFEGNIPEGEYGAGSVIVWDRGTWEPEGDPHEGLEKGHLTFTLKGRKLKGRWHLVRMRQKPRERQESWLLIKAEDEAARHPGDPDVLEEEPRSVLSRKTIEEVARSKNRLPPFIEPCLATLAKTPPSGPNWVHEIKFDGYRIQATVNGKKVRLLTRKGLDWTEKFGSLADDFRALPITTAIIDGELVVEDANGVSSFSALQNALKAGNDGALRYYAFDLLYRDGRDLRKLTLEQRKAQLAELLSKLPAGSRIRLSQHFETKGTLLLKKACSMGLEGIISKRRDLPYGSGRSKSWIKTKCSERQEFVIVGFTPSTTAKRAIGALALGQYEGGKLVYRGRVGTGFDERTAAELFAKLQPLQRTTPTVSEVPAAEKRRGLKWVEPQLVAEISFRSWTAGGIVRHAVFEGLREDKPASEVVMEKAADNDAAENSPQVDETKLTHPERLLWRDAGITKLGLAQYYAEVWPYIAPHIVRRPLSVVRCPDGADRTCFFQKHVKPGMAEGILRVRPKGEKEDYIYIDDFNGLIGLVQASVLEIHPWGCRIEDTEHADRLTFDLDPGPGVEWSAVVAAAREVKEVLADSGLESFVKTSGGKGLHVVVPLDPAASWEHAKEFCLSVAQFMARREPEKYTATMAKKARARRIFVDYLRNGKGATSVAAYSTRARPGAPVSTPLSWDELSSEIGPSFFTVLNIPARLKHIATDPWAGIEKVQQGLPHPISRESSPPARGRVRNRRQKDAAGT
jgi:bifunctional non-homologous end joining protein LigD